MPRLISIEIDRSEPPDLDALRNAVESTFPAAKLDDHRRWQAEIRPAAFICLDAVSTGEGEEDLCEHELLSDSFIDSAASL